MQLVMAAVNATVSQEEHALLTCTLKHQQWVRQSSSGCAGKPGACSVGIRFLMAATGGNNGQLTACGSSSSSSMQFVHDSSGGHETLKHHVFDVNLAVTAGRRLWQGSSEHSRSTSRLAPITNSPPAPPRPTTAAPPGVVPSGFLHHYSGRPGPGTGVSGRVGTHMRRRSDSGRRPEL